MPARHKLFAVERLLRERLAKARRQTFVGRAAERDRFGAALKAGVEPEFVVLSVQGEGGIGKSALLRMFADQAIEAGCEVTLVDGHDVRPNPEAFLRWVGPVVQAGPMIVLVDSYELLEPLDGWLREEFVPGLADGSLVVIAGRRPLSAGWLDDPGWRTQLRTIRLGPLDPDDATRCLATTGMPADVCSSAAAAVRGHPLALALVADVLATRGRAALEESLLGDPDVLAPLVSRLLDVAPDELHRRALAVCALARFTTESLLRDVLEITDVGALFDWLRGLSCTEAGKGGLYPHDLAREVLEADLRWRDEDRHSELLGRIMARTHRRIGAETGTARRERILDLLFQARNHPAAGRYWNWETFGAVTGEPADAVAPDELLDLVAHHEGPDSAAVAGRWLRSQPEAFTVYRRWGELAGMVAWVTLSGVDDDVRADPVAAAAWQYAGKQAPLAAGEQVLLNRFTVDRELHQAPCSPAVDLNSMINIELGSAGK